MIRSLALPLFALLLAAGCAEKDAAPKQTTAARPAGDPDSATTAAERRRDRSGPPLSELGRAITRDRADRPDDAERPRLTPDERQARRDERRAEQLERRQEMMDTFDADGDGTLSDVERSAMMESRVTDMVARFDTDADGKLSQAEMAARPARRGPDFATLDADKDGFVTPAEMTAARAARRAAGDTDGPRRSRRVPMGGTPTEPAE